VVASWTRYGLAGSDGEPPAPSGVLQNRNLARSLSFDKASQACAGPSGALTAEYNAKRKATGEVDPKTKAKVMETQFQYFCPKGADSPPREFPLDRIASGVDTATSDRIFFQYKCLYSCADGQAKVRYAGQDPASDTIAPLDTAGGREDARLADFAVYRPRMDHACLNAVTASPEKYPDPKSRKIISDSVESLVLFACKGVKMKKGLVDIPENTNYATNFNGDLSHAPLPYNCTYRCDCATNTCSDAKALLIAPDGDEDLRGSTNLNKKPPGALPEVDPTDKQVKQYQDVANSKCMEQAKTL
jgi:hypothetical protein